MRRAAFIFIFVTVLLDMLAVGLIIPVLPRLLLSFLEGNTAKAAATYGLFATVVAVGQFVMSPVLGALSDRVGRRPVILLSNLGTGLDWLVMAMAPTLGWLFLGRIVSGITSASISTASAYVADVTEPEKRAGAFGMLGAAFSIGFVVGPALGGLLGSISLRLPFYAAAGLCLLNAAYGFFVLPESLTPEKRRPFSWLRANPIGALSLLRHKRSLIGLASVSFLNSLAQWVLPATFVLYAGARFGWTERDVGLTLALVGVTSGIVQGGLVRPLVKRFGERRTLIVGLCFGFASFVIYGLAPNGVVFLSGVPIGALWGLTTPSAQGLMSQRVESTEQGLLQGMVGSLQGIAGLIGPFVFTQILARAIGTPLPGAAYLLSAALMVVAITVATIVVRQLIAPPAVSNA